MSEALWRFPGNGGGKVNGLDTADINTFQKDSMSSLAREICQNSIDAKDPNKDGPVIIEFHSFLMNSANIPGYDVLISEIDACKNYWSKDYKTLNRLLQMKSSAEAEMIPCLRISDFNTTGLVGVSDFNDQRSPWYSLIHGSGMSEKNGATGGSKGIGKYATFATSSFRTVFYSTSTVKGEQGYEGIAYLCAARKANSPNGELTQGMGYFGSDEVNNSLSGFVNFDSSFDKRDLGEKGTDIYILGFRNNESWKKDIITKTLESFMVAVFRGRLVVKVDDILIDKDTLSTIVFDPNLINPKKAIGRNVISQYILLSRPEKVFQDHIDIDVEGEKLGTIDLYSDEFEGDDQQYATHKCVMVRYPYMKIKDMNTSSSLAVSALCIIQDDRLNSLLKNTENPQHTDWEVNRAGEDSALVSAVIKQMNSKIDAVIFDHLQAAGASSVSKTDANEYLPAHQNDSEEGNGVRSEKVSVKAHITKTKAKVRSSETNVSADDPEGNGVVPDIVSNDESGEETSLEPTGHNKGKGKAPGPGDNEETGTHDDNGHETFVRKALKGIQYRFFCNNREKGEFTVIFYCPELLKSGELELYRLDDAGSRTPVEVLDASCNGESLGIKDNRTIALKGLANEKIVIRIKTPYQELFSAEIHLYKCKEESK